MTFFTTNISKKSIILVNQVLKSGFISAGSIAEKFETQLNKKLGFINTVSLNSGTSALNLALNIAGVGYGDEVILPPQTFIATGMVILQQFAKPVFADIQIDTGNICPDSILKSITKKTKAIIPVHWGGYPCDLKEINEIAKEYKLAVIEDAAHALGASYDGKPIGNISRFTAFSFQAIKHLTTGDGGALCCIIKNDFKQAKKRRWFDIDREHSNIGTLGERLFDANVTGFKYHMNDISAAIGLGNIENINRILNHHKIIASVYHNELKKIDGIKLLNYQKNRQSTFWFYNILVQDRNNFIRAMKSRNIPVSIVHSRIDKYSVFGGIRKELINQREFENKQVSLPINFKIKKSDIKTIIREIKKGW
jgi:perosamine synthetase